MNVVTSEVQIMNSALIKIGAETIISPSADNTRARLCNARYAIIRDKLLRSHIWNFAKNFVELANIDPLPAGIFKYTYAFQLPSDCLRILETSLGQLDEWEQVSNNMLLCQSSAVSIEYIKRETDVTKYDANFVEALACMLALDICYSITQSTSQVEMLEKMTKETLRDARTFDSQVGRVRQVESNEWLDSRRY